jgi:ribosomal protein L7Ae-like RNA K-turn-binding protein
MDKTLGMLSLCKKAGKLKAGFDPAALSLGRDAALVVFSADASPKTKDRMAQKAADAGIPCVTLPQTADEIGFATGKRVVVLAVTDEGMARQVLRLTGEQNKEVM